MKETVLEIAKLEVTLPNGEVLLSGIDLHVGHAEVVAILGASGSGKSTLLRVLFEREELEQKGFIIDAQHLETQGDLGFVPQNGAVFDHLDVSENIRLPLRHMGGVEDTEGQVRHWLRTVDLDESWATAKKPVSQLSTGQAQRLAVARVLASGRRVLFMDEPTAGLDPLRVRTLSRRLRELCDQNRMSLVVVTHDVHFAAEFADRIFVLRDHLLDPISVSALPEQGCRTGQDLSMVCTQLERALTGLQEPTLSMDDRRNRVGMSTKLTRDFLHALLSPFAVLTQTPWRLMYSLRRTPRDFLHIFAYTLRQALLRPLLFYFVVSLLLGYTIYYVLSGYSEDFNAGQLLHSIRGMPIIALTPPITAFLYVATSASAINAWLGGMRLSRQVSALEALGISRIDYLWGPAWLALVLSFCVLALLFATGFLLGADLHYTLQGVSGGWDLLVSDLIDPDVRRRPYRLRALFLIVIYSVGIASDAIARADEPKEKADHVPHAMTRSVVFCTLWVVSLELLTLFMINGNETF